MPTTSTAIGIFDSGLGGLSVLKEVAQTLPHESLIYLADSLNAPYGEKPASYIEARTLSCCAWLINQGAKALVVACNTATVHTIQLLRARYPNIPLIGVEPGIKPAATISRSHIVGVLATERTLKSQKFTDLLEQISLAHDNRVQFICQAGIGLVPLIEAGKIDTPETDSLLRKYLEPMREAGADTLVLGCTHYPFLTPSIQRIYGEKFQLIDTGLAIARQVERLLREHHLSAKSNHPPQHRFYSTYGAEHLEQMLSKLLNVNARADTVVID